jgi:hypothetical protein
LRIILFIIYGTEQSNREIIHTQPTRIAPYKLAATEHRLHNPSGEERRSIIR